MRRLAIGLAVLLLLVGVSVRSQQTAGNPHGELKWDCQACHTVESWSKMKEPLTFDHGQTGFPLLGRHRIATCSGCHKDLHFDKVESTCEKCHNDVHRGQMGTDCRNCHTSENWQNRKDVFQLHSQNGFLLAGVHALTDCEACHKHEPGKEYSSVTTECQGCHAGDYNSTQDPDHATVGFSLHCETCHSLQALGWQNVSFEHPAAFPLVGAHARVSCAACHQTSYAGTSVNCYTCHQNDFTGAKDPDHTAGSYDHDCVVCHSMDAWKPASLDHNRTRFPLTGAHQQVACSLCHIAGFTVTSTACYDCHKDKFASVTDPNHVAGNFDHNCATCHTTAAWKPATFDHSKTNFALTGVHVTTACASCHSAGFAGTPTACYNCHQDKFVSAKNPDHAANNFDHDCSNCHGTSAWQPSTFDHSNTIFPLTGSHASTTCISCHANGFANAPSDCYSCHQDKFAGTKDPDHVANNFPHDCTGCHNTSSWGEGSFNHSSTSFPLTGAHSSVTCLTCHTSGFANTPTDCYSCHQDKFASTTEPDHISSNCSHTCTQCHTTAAWTPVSFDHGQTNFALTGAHTGAKCASCHVTAWAGTVTDCYGCHQDRYTAVKDPDHITNNYSHTCTQCHSTTAWTPAQFDHNQTAFPLTGAHTFVTCTTCHTSTYAGTPASCYSCHQDKYTSIKDPDHVRGNYDHICTQCHTTTAWTGATFDHNLTTFPLTGAHSTTACASCHATGFTGTSRACYGCHQDKFTSVQDPNHVSGNFDHDCSICHTTAVWKPATFDHSLTSFQLAGKHIGVTCTGCHTNGFATTPTDCYSCHQSAFASANSPSHTQNNFSHDCTTCHNTAGWQPSTFNHSSTSFPLTGAHLSQDCIACHISGYVSTSPACYSCHATSYADAKDPDHVANSFGHECQQCHSTTVWSPSTFNHSAIGFPLTGKHSGLTCISCHSGGYVNTSVACYSCHEPAFAGASNPNHIQNNFDHDCSKCHSINGWTPSTFNHATTAFPLTGVHLSQTCIACHVAGYVSTPKDCYSCHQSAFTGVSDPNHVTNNFSHDCTLCHTTSSWSTATFDHTSLGFPLTGGHQGVACISCHSGGYTNTSPVCYVCHQPAFTGATSPNHLENNFDHDCTKCHNLNGWSPSTFNHASTQFPLTGAHASLTCIACHSGGYVGTSKDCYSCHQSAFTGVADPNHVTNNFSHDCTTCHGTTAWSPATFNHSTTAFPLTGAHTSLTCISCHAAGYANTPTTCYSCHQSAFTGATDPNHVAAAFATTCANCHSTTAWTPSTYNHATTGWPLTGQHLGQHCIACHATVYAGTSTACYSCHQTAYAGTTNPNHATANFPTDCQTCHTTNAWTPANWNHDTQYFPIYSGEHRGRWSTCATCHTNSSNYAVFSCITGCHGQSSTNSDHRDVSNYQYNSNACYNCHPRGSSGG